MDTAPPPPPPCLSILGFLGYSDDPGIIPGWTHHPPPLSGITWEGYSDDPEIPGWTHLTPPCQSLVPGIVSRIIPGSQLPPPPRLSILGFLGYSDDPGIIPGWTQLSILGFLGYSDDPRIIPGWMDTALTPPPLSEYPGIPGILGRSWDHPRMDTAHPPCLSILGFLGYSDDPRIIPGWTQSLRCLSILRLVVHVGVWYTYMYQMW